MSDAFARSSAARAWQEAKDARADIAGILDRLNKIEPRIGTVRKLQQCRYCGEFSLAPVCRNHVDLLEVDNLAPKDAA